LYRPPSHLQRGEGPICQDGDARSTSRAPRPDTRGVPAVMGTSTRNGVVVVGLIVGLLIVIAIALVLLKVAIAAGLVGLIALILLILLLLGRI
jgi:hypothetical protein